MPQIFKNFEARFGEDDVTGGRNELFAFYNKHIFSDWKHLVFGVGMQNYGDKVNQIHNTSMNVSHNGYQEAVAIWGVMGLVLMIYLIYLLVKKAKASNKEIKIINFVPLIVYLVYIISGQFFTSGISMMVLLFTFVGMCYTDKPTKLAVADDE